MDRLAPAETELIAMEAILLGSQHYGDRPTRAFGLLNSVAGLVLRFVHETCEADMAAAASVSLA